MKKLFLTGTALVILDQLTKSAFYKQWAILTQFLAIKYHENTGAAFGILPNSTTLLAAIGAAVLVTIAFYYHRLSRKREPSRLLSFGLLLLFAGTAGNLIDRVYLGYVRDFIAVWIWPTFNLADAYCTVGAALIIIYLIKEDYPAAIGKMKKCVKKIFS